jgi:hypothetical protein
MRTSKDDAVRLANTIRQAISERSGQNLPVRLVIIDTMSRALNGGKENDEDMGLLLKHTDFVRRETGVAVLFIAHCGKDAAKGIRGWSGVRAAIDAEIEITKNDGQHIAHVTKERDLPDGDRFGFSLKQVEVGLNSRGRKVTTRVIVHAEDAGNPAAAAAKPKKAWAPSLRLLKLILESALVEHGLKIAPFVDGPMVRAVDIESLREEFCRQYLSSGETDKRKAANAKNEAFRRAIKAAQPDLVACRTIGEKQFIWMVASEGGVC